MCHESIIAMFGYWISFVLKILFKGSLKHTWCGECDGCGDGLGACTGLCAVTCFIITEYIELVVLRRNFSIHNKMRCLWVKFVIQIDRRQIKPKHIDKSNGKNNEKKNKATKKTTVRLFTWCCGDGGWGAECPCVFWTFCGGHGRDCSDGYYK